MSLVLNTVAEVFAMADENREFRGVCECYDKKGGAGSNRQIQLFSHL